MALLEISGRERTDVVEGYGLPSHLYTSREVLEIERKEIFGKTWQFAVHESDISSPGSYALARLGEFPETPGFTLESPWKPGAERSFPSSP
ncbi:MAG: hypothetical protein QOK29_1577 [Rhodospirillaceae bacterium]|nr:hypothetical protein [Rhodospirillaceae bacterium]